MRFYRLEARDLRGRCLGYTWSSSKRALFARRAELRRAGQVVTLELVELEPSRSGILRALNLYASHPDNPLTEDRPL